MSPLLAALMGQDPATVVAALLDRMVEDNEPRDFGKAVRLARFWLAFDLQGNPTGISEDAIREAVEASEVK